MAEQTKPQWNNAIDGKINAPDALEPIINSVINHIQFVLISGKDHVQAACDIVANCQEFFKQHPEAL